MSPPLDLTADGPTELDWARVCGGLPPFVWPSCRRVVVVSPHPDDETFGVGGVIAVAVERGIPVLVVSVTDGEAASPAPDVAAIRRAELAAALSCLDPSDSTRTVRLGFADSRVSASLAALTGDLARHVRPDDLVLCPLPDDGHPDHDATSVAATSAAEAAGATVRWYPIWAWHCHSPSETPLAGGERMALSQDVLERKRRAAACHVSQIEGGTPVVPPEMLVRLLRPFEVLVAPR